MNTASGMESNGQPGRIHVSEDTAKELVAKGKESWLEARQDKIVAKGLGELQAYWVVPTGSRTVRSEHSQSSSVRNDSVSC